MRGDLYGNVLNLIDLRVSLELFTAAFTCLLQTLAIYQNPINLQVLLFLDGGYHHTITQNIQLRSILIENFLNLIDLQVLSEEFAFISICLGKLWQTTKILSNCKFHCTFVEANTAPRHKKTKREAFLIENFLNRIDLRVLLKVFTMTCACLEKMLAGYPISNDLRV